MTDIRPFTNLHLVDRSDKFSGQLIAPIGGMLHFRMGDVQPATHLEQWVVVAIALLDRAVGAPSLAPRQPFC